MSARRQISGRFRVLEWATVTVQLWPTRSCAMGLPTMLERPTTTASSPARSRRTDRISSRQPRGVQDTRPGAPVMSLPALIGWNPSTSLAGSMASITFWASICRGSGSCTRMPSTAGSPLSRATRLRSSASLVEAGSLCWKERMPTSTVWRALLAT
jgi:hypothetical protein